MRYNSTRGGDKNLTASQAILQGIAKDGGLFVPEYIPVPEKSLKEMETLSYQELAYEILKLYLTDYDENELKTCIARAYEHTFSDKQITPLVKKDDGLFFLELFHGRTLAFKDVALSILPHFLLASAKKNQTDKEIIIVTATSGDTGKAALEAFKDVKGTQVIVLYPENGVSLMQELQMATQEGANTSVFALKGNFDDAQTAVKEIFLDKELEERLDRAGCMLSSANSINIGRLLPQIVYYFYAYLRLVQDGELQSGAKVDFVVPTGNFGDILAGYYAKKMGLPVGKLVCASNVNNILFDFFRTKTYNVNRPFKQTMAPSIDILISSNLERLLYDVKQDPEKIRQLMSDLKHAGEYIFDDDFQDFSGYFSDEEETAAAISEVYEQYGYIIDTHTAVAYSAFQKFKKEEPGGAPAVVLATASPYKFTRAVMDAIAPQRPGTDGDDFMLAAEMEKLAPDQKTPDQIKQLKTKKRLHTGVLDKSALKETLFDTILKKK